MSETHFKIVCPHADLDGIGSPGGRIPLESNICYYSVHSLKHIFVTGVNELHGKRIVPSSGEEGWTRHQEIVPDPFRSGRGGVGQEEFISLNLINTTPSAR